MAGFCGSNDKYTDNPIQYDPLGRNSAGNNTGATGGPEMRSNIFSYLQNNTPDIRGQVGQWTNAIGQAANNAGFTDAANLAKKTINGAFLQPAQQVKSALQNTWDRAAAGAADVGAGIKSQFARSGLSYSTPYQQAQQANVGATNAQQSATASNALLANYQAERQNQVNAGGALAQATSTPLSYYSQYGQAAQAQMAPITQLAQIIAGLAGGGQIATPSSSVVRSPGAMDYITSLIGAIA
jgi:hypothetical protein